MSDYPEIVPKGASEARGIDICGTDFSFKIIRSDLGVYMTSTDFHEASNIRIYSLSEPCRWGDHYIGTSIRDDKDLGIDYDSNFYIIKGNEVRRVKNMSTDENAELFSLHPNCRGGTHYFAVSEYFYIVFADRKVYRRVKDMQNDEDGNEYNIPEAFLDGIYLFGRFDPLSFTSYVCCLKQGSKWGVSYVQSYNYTDEDPETYSVHESVVNFLPGGLAQTKGKAFGYWDKLKSFKNDSKVTVDWEQTVKDMVGFKKSEMSSIEQNWSIEVGAQYSAGDLTAAIAKYQFSLKVQFGGKSINTDQQEWSETKERSETIKIKVPPDTEVFVWQYQLGFGDEKSLFCADLEITQDPNPPQKPPGAIN